MRSNVVTPNPPSTTEALLTVQRKPAGEGGGICGSQTLLLDALNAFDRAEPVAGIWQSRRWEKKRKNERREGENPSGSARHVQAMRFRHSASSLARLACCSTPQEKRHPDPRSYRLFSRLVLKSRHQQRHAKYPLLPAVLLESRSRSVSLLCLLLIFNSIRPMSDQFLLP
jgi:hypothetical protein